jgi:ATP-dependent helicase/nuclease subunit A
MSEGGKLISVRWTEQQRRAIEHGGGDLLVSAAAGSGKTAVLAERCARLVCDEGEGSCGVEGLLVLTFTDAAANEMRERIAKAIRARLTDGVKRSGERVRWLRRQAAMVERATISTLHAFCARVLRQHFSEAGIDPAFELMDEEEARLMREEALEEVLARRHGLSGEEGKGFADFFEAYAQGSDGNCREILLRVHQMLASTADPAGYVAASRRMYAVEGLGAVVGRFVKEVVGEKLRLLVLTAERACAEVRARVGEGPMDEGLTGALDMLVWARGEVETRGGEALGDVRAALSGYPWAKRLKTVEGVEDFEGLKKRTWFRVKNKMEELCEEELAVEVGELARDLGTLGPSLEALLALVGDFQRVYGEAKRGKNRLDFSDLERMTLELLVREGGAARRELQKRYCHVLVDEFQDINPLQEALLRAVRSGERFEGKGNLFVVGDVKQAIYGFRLAQPELFLERERAAREEEDGVGHVGLPHNFRSHAGLLGAMNGVFEKLLTEAVAGVRYGEGHALEVPEGSQKSEVRSQKGEGEGLRVFTGVPVEVHLVAMKTVEEEDGEEEKEHVENLSAVEEEARMVAERIRGLMGEGRGVMLKDGGGAVRKLAYRDIAILMRTMKNKAMIFTRALAEAGIPVHADLSTGYFDTTEVRETLALLQVMDNPQQDIPLATVLLGPYGRFSHDDLAVLRLTFDRKSVSFAEAARRYPLVGETVRSGVGDGGREGPPFDAGLAERLREVFAKIERWRGFLRTRPLHEGLAAIYAESKILPYVAGLEAGGQRVANLQALHQRALKFSGFSKQGLHRFLRFIEKLRDQEGDFGEAPVVSEASDVVRILSVHKSKGLEFPVVIVAGLGSPARGGESGAVVLHREWGIGLQMVDVERNVAYPSAASAAMTAAAKRSGRAEELRLLYVAMTRARECLILTGHVKQEEAVERWREAARGYGQGGEGLPEDVLMGGRVYLEWVMPALASGRLRVQWGEENGEAPEVVMRVHAARGGEKKVVAEREGIDAVRVAMVAGEVLPAGFVVAEGDVGVERMMERVTAQYAYEELSEEPAVRTVSELKKVEGEEVQPVRVRGVGVEGGGEEALRRGVATHRVLEVLDFTRCGDAAAIQTQVGELVERAVLSAGEVADADMGGIGWFLLETAVGRRAVEAATRRAAGEAGVHVRREIAFTWVAPLEGGEGGASSDPADWPTIRGAVDLLLVDAEKRVAEIVDYKTDSVGTWQGNLAGYERQMGYYLRAASEILGFGVERATVVFLAAREVREVRGGKC